MTLAACGNETSTAPPDRVVPRDALMYVEVDLTLAEDQEEGLAQLVENATGKAPEGDPLLAAVEALTDGRAGPLTEVRGDLGWLGDKIAYVSVSPLREHRDHGIVAIVKDGGDAIDAIADAMGEEPREADIAGQEARRMGRTDVYAAEVREYVVAGGRNLVEQVLRTAGGGRSLNTEPAYVQAMRGRGRQLAAAYIDVPRLVRASARLKARATENLGRKALGRPYAYGIDFEDDIATFDQLTGGTELDGVGATSMVAQVPSDAWLSLGFRDLREKGMDLLSDAASLMEMPQAAPGPARRALASVGMDLRRDVFGWMGDAALWAAGDEASAVRFGVLIEAEKPARARAALAKLRFVMGGRGTASDFSVRHPDGSGVRAELEDGIVRLEYAGPDARPAKGTVMDGPLGKAAAEPLDGAQPALLADVRAIGRLVAEDDDAELDAMMRYLKPFTTIVGIAGPKGNPRIVGRIR